MAACDKCSFDYFQVIAEFYKIVIRRCSKQQRRSKGKSCIYYSFFLFYCVLFRVFSVHLDLDLIVLSSESRFMSVCPGGGGSPPQILVLILFFIWGGGGWGVLPPKKKFFIYLVKIPYNCAFIVLRNRDYFHL